MGSLYKRGDIWWAKYYVNGRAIRVSTETGKEKQAREFLKKHEGKAAAGEPILPRVDRVRYEEIAQDLRRHYETTGERQKAEYEARLKHLDPFFAPRRVANISGADATRYVAARQGEGAANGTINRELAVLGRMLRLAYEHGKLLRLPVIRKLKEAAPRQGFFERDAYEAVRRRLRPDLQVAVAIEYAFGWRCQSEVLRLERRQVGPRSWDDPPRPGHDEERRGAPRLPPAGPQGADRGPGRPRAGARGEDRTHHSVPVPAPAEGPLAGPAARGLP
jgi:hypothetical protein